MAGALCALLAAGWLRFRRGSLTVPALLVTVPILVAVGFVALHHNLAVVGNSPWAIASAMLVTDLIGPNAGLTVFGLICLEVLVALELDRFGLALSSPLFAGDAGFTSFAEIGLVGMIAAGALSWVYVASRMASQRSLKRAHQRAADSEANLKALIENTTDVICSLDTEGRVVTMNSALQRRYLEAGIELKVGDELAAKTVPGVQEQLRTNVRRALSGERVRSENYYEVDGRKIWMELFYSPIPGDSPASVRGVTLFARDVTARKESGEKLEEMHRRLMSASFQAGAAEFATGILHNVGNTLNSVNVSANVVAEKLGGSKVTGLAKAADLLRQHQGDLAEFLSRDPRGSKLPVYLIGLAGTLTDEREEIQKEVGSLNAKIEHIKSIIQLQQDHAKLGGVVEKASVEALVDDALQLHEVSLGRLGIEIDRQYQPLPPIAIDRHKLLQILVNLLGNARHALMNGGQSPSGFTLRVGRAEGGMQLVEVQDNGIGIPPENMAKIFRQGFTTKPDGHGFGLHMSLLMAKGWAARSALPARAPIGAPASRFCSFRRRPPSRRWGLDRRSTSSSTRGPPPAQSRLAPTRRRLIHPSLTRAAASITSERFAPTLRRTAGAHYR